MEAEAGYILRGIMVLKPNFQYPVVYLLDVRAVGSRIQDPLRLCRFVIEKQGWNCTFLSPVTWGVSSSVDRLRNMTGKYKTALNCRETEKRSL